MTFRLETDSVGIMKQPNKSCLTGKGRKQWIAYFEKLSAVNLLASYHNCVAEKNWDLARMAKAEMNERRMKENAR